MGCRRNVLEPLWGGGGGVRECGGAGGGRTLSAAELIEAADAMMYHVKESGGDRIQIQSWTVAGFDVG